MRARDNPFATHRLDAIPYLPQGETWGGSLQRLEDLGWRGAVVGAEGSGKTALLHDLAPRLEALGFIVHFFRLNPMRGAIPQGGLVGLSGASSPRLFVLLDDTERLGKPVLRQFLRASSAWGGLVMATHFAGIMPTWVKCETSPRLLQSLARDLLGAHVEGMDELCRQLFAIHRGNIRSALLALYDRWAADG